MNEAYLLLGSNMGNSNDLLTDAKNRISEIAGVITASSSIYKTNAWGNEQQNDFLNQVIFIKTVLSASLLLRFLLSIEEKMGRIRTVKNAPRTIDIDILFFNDDIINVTDLKVPHPLIQLRRFVLVPMTELNPGYVHPVLKKSIQQLLIECTDTLDVKKN